MKKRLFAFIVAALITSVSITLTGCRGDESSTPPYISSKDEIYYATGYVGDQTQPDTSDSKNKKSNNSSNSVNPDASQLAEDTTYPTVVSESNAVPNNVNPNASSVADNSNKTSKAITLSSSSVDLRIGQSKTISVSVNVDETNTSSYYAETNNDNASVACSGSTITITGKKAGNSTVIVNSGNKRASCNVIILGNQTTEPNITDDTEVEYKKLCTDYYQAKITSGINIGFYNDGNGAVYTSSLKKGDKETVVIEVPYSKLKDKKASINALIKDLRNQFENEIKNADDNEVFDIKNYKINCYSEKQNNNEYTIYFCYQKL